LCISFTLFLATPSQLSAFSNVLQNVVDMPETML
jgi:hypothetical protein